MTLLRLTCLCGWCQSPGGWGGGLQGWSRSQWTHTRGLTLLTALSSFLQVSETNTSSASAASPSLPFTRTVAAAQGRLGAAASVISTSLSLFPSLSLLQALCLSLSLATGSSIGCGKRQEHSGKVVKDLVDSFCKYLCCVLMCEDQLALTTTTHTSLQAFGESFTPASCSPFFHHHLNQPTHPPTLSLPAPHQLVEVSHQLSANRTAAHSLRLE